MPRHSMHPMQALRSAEAFPTGARSHLLVERLRHAESEEALYPIVFSQFRTENRLPLFLELL